MWIRAKNTYSGPEGTFVRGELREVDEAVLKGIPKRKLAYTVERAPWERDVDEPAREAARLRNQIFMAGLAITGKEQAMENACKQIAICDEGIAEFEQAKTDLREKLAKLAEQAGKLEAAVAKKPAANARKKLAGLQSEMASYTRQISEVDAPQLRLQARKLLWQAGSLDDLHSMLDMKAAVADCREKLAAIYKARPDLKPAEKDDGKEDDKKQDAKAAADAQGQAVADVQDEVAE